MLTVLAGGVLPVFSKGTPAAFNVDTLEVVPRDGLNIHQTLLMPDPPLGQRGVPGRAAPRHQLGRIDAAHTERQGSERDPAVRVRRARPPETAAIRRRLERGRRGEGAAQGARLSQCLLDAPCRDLAGRRVAAAVVVVVAGLRQEPIGRDNRGAVLAPARPDAVVLQPPIGPLELALRWRGEGGAGADAALAAPRRPLRIDVLGPSLLPNLAGRTTPHEAEEGRTVHGGGVGIRRSGARAAARRRGGARPSRRRQAARGGRRAGSVPRRRGSRLRGQGLPGADAAERRRAVSPDR